MTTSLPTTRLGRTGMHLTRAGFGAWAIGGGDWAYAWGDQDGTASIAAIWHAERTPARRPVALASITRRHTSRMFSVLPVNFPPVAAPGARSPRARARQAR
jgi:hypothetical protein